MKYLIKTDSEILDLLPGLRVPLFLNEGEILEAVEDESLLTLPLDLYTKATRPAYVKIRDKNYFDVIGCEFGKDKFYVANTSWAGDTCNINITSKFSAHVITQAAEGLSDINAISLQNINEAIDTGDNSEITVRISNVSYNITLNSGQASFEYDYAGKEQQSVYYIHINNYEMPIISNVPESIKLLADLRVERDAKLKLCDWLVIRHSSQDNKTLSDSQYAELQAYMQALRDLPASADLNNITWPTKPSFI